MHWHDRVLTNKRKNPHGLVEFRSGRILIDYTSKFNFALTGSHHLCLTPNM